MEEIRVEDAMTKNVITVSPEESVINLAKKMRDNDIGSMLVCKDGKLLGLITSEDLIKRVLIPNKDPETLKAKDIMTKKLITTTPDEDLVDAIHVMIDNGIKRLPVVEDDKVVGILTDGDILRIAPNLVEFWMEGKKEDEEESETIGGICEVCGNYSDNLKRVNGLWVCEGCRESTPEI